MRTVELQVTTDGDGNGVYTSGIARSGFVDAVHVDYAAGAAAGTDVVLSCLSDSDPTVTILTLTDNNTDGWYYPRTVAHTLAGVAQTAYEVRVPFKGFLRLTVAQGGDTVSDCVTVRVYYSE